MPIYAYKCQKCSHVHEVFHRSSNSPHPEACPECGAAKPQRVMSAVASVVKSASPAGCESGMCGMPSGPCGGGGCAFN